jgi:integrase
MACKITSPSQAAEQAAHMLVYLTANRVQTSSMDTYASAVHRFIKFGTTVGGKTMSELLPPGPQGVIDTTMVKLFISWASTKYKITTIKLTLSALVDWHKSKGASPASVSSSHPELKALLQAVAVQQGPQGLPVGKVGMPKTVLRLLVGYLASRSTQQPREAPLFTRDTLWLLLGFYGFLRRSEIIGLKMEDVVIKTHPKPHIALRIRKSKTDQRQAGATVLIAPVSGDGIRILDRVTSYMDQRRSRDGAGDGDPLFPAWNLDSRALSSSQPLQNGGALAKRLKTYLTELLGLYPHIAVNPSSYGMHSLRRGGVVAAWGAGVQVERIKAHGRWRSDAVRAYLQANFDVKISVTLAM